LVTSFDVDGLDVRVAGSGPAVVLLHAGVADQRMWDGVVERLSHSHTVATYDRRGFGSSPAPSAGYRPLDDLVTVVDHLDMRQAAFVGNSAGAKLALDLAGAMPDRVTRLALLAAPIGGWDWSPVMGTYFEAEDKALRSGDIDAALQLNLDQWIRGPARAWTPTIRAWADEVGGAMRLVLQNQLTTEERELDDGYPPVEERLGDIRIPTLVGVGDQDVPDFVAIAELLAASVPGAELVRFAGTGHLVPVEQPDAVVDQLLRFLGTG